MMQKDVLFKLPFLWEGVREVTVVSLLVQKGDYLSSGAAIMEVETDDALCELPIDFEGEIIEWYVNPGDKLMIGASVCSIHTFQAPSTEEFRKFYLEITELLGLKSTASLDLIRAEIGKIIAMKNS